jgi:hypothetical protein
VPLRPLAMPDLFALEAGLGVANDAPESGSRPALQKRFATRWGWLSAAGGLVLPLLGVLAVLYAVAVWRLGRRGHAVAIAGLGCAGTAITLAGLLA